MAAAAHVKDRQRQRSAHEDDCRPGGHARQHVGRSAGTEGGLRTLSAEGAGQIGRAALLQQNDADENQADDNVDDNNEVEENLHCSGCFQIPRGQAGQENL